MTEDWIKLLGDEICRVCYHIHPHGECVEIAEDPGPDGPVYSICHCKTYVDAEAEGNIVVRKETP